MGVVLARLGNDLVVELVLHASFDQDRDGPGALVADDLADQGALEGCFSFRHGHSLFGRGRGALLLGQHAEHTGFEEGQDGQRSGHDQAEILESENTKHRTGRDRVASPMRERTQPPLMRLTSALVKASSAFWLALRVATASSFAATPSNTPAEFERRLAGDPPASFSPALAGGRDGGAPQLDEG
eukprot:gene47230-64006_t